MIAAACGAFSTCVGDPSYTINPAAPLPRSHVKYCEGRHHDALMFRPQSELAVVLGTCIGMHTAGQVLALSDERHELGPQPLQGLRRQRVTITSKKLAETGSRRLAYGCAGA